ncbi:MAG: hypothetical protein QOF48_313 [Verrucomicrobiota bacterium]|jgi:hypothetical protein
MLAFGLFITGLVSEVRAALPVITEIMPDNAGTLADEDGDFPDWIEIYNPGPGSVNLQGWFLTDNPALLTNWAFPAVNLSPGGYLVVFASGKNRTNDPARLHTSFQLEASGEYLALVQPDGMTIASAFSPAFRSVKTDVSFGIAQSLVSVPLLATSAPRVLVPSMASDLAPNWNLPPYVPDAAWATGGAPPAVGFDTNLVSGVPSNVAPGGTAAQSTVNGAFTPNLALNGNFGDFTHTLGTDPAPFWQVTLTNQTFVYSIVLYNRTSCCGSRLRDITIEILTTNATGTVTNFSSALLNPENAGFSYPGGPAVITNDLVALTGSAVPGQIIRVRRTPDPDLSGSGGQGNADEAAVLSLGEVVVNAGGPPGLRPFFTTDIQAQMWNHNSSAFLRIPFVSTNTPDYLTLRARYDDGFIAYLNGVEIARRNFVGTPQWNSVANTDRALTTAAVQETIDVSAGLSAWINGTNILGVQLLNVFVSDPNALFQPELIGTRLIVTTNVYFSDPTPGSANTTGWYFDEVADTHFSVNRGFFTNAFALQITNSTPGSQIYYSFNGDEPGPAKGILYTGPITITNTSVVRTRAFRDGWKATDVDTGTYIFLADVTSQAPNWQQNNVPPPYFPASWGANTVDYGMDPNVVSLYTPAQWREALTQIPTLSIVTEMPNLFDSAIGIYANASQHGEDWERPASLELLDPASGEPGRFQENCGLRVRGGASRDPSFRKHSLRVFFRKEYGAGKLSYPLFDNEGADEFETFDIRTSQNYSWPRNDSSTHDTMVRESFCRQTLGAMGQPYRRSRYYHLYLNGQYWGLYETDERPEASYGQTYFGGSKTNFDVVKCANHIGNFATEATDGTLTVFSNLWTICQSMRTNAANSNYFRTIGCNPDGTRNPGLPVLLDVDNLIDYMLEIIYSGDGDATLSSFLGNNQPNNWFGMRDRSNPDVGFRFFNSDCEHTLGSPNSQVDRTGPFGGSNEGNFTYANPQWMHEELMRNAEYRVRFGDHVQKHFFNGGALTVQSATNRFIARASQITKAVRAYSARWGDSIKEPPYGESDWTNEINTILTSWFPPRTSLVLAQLTNDLLFPTIAAPLFSSQGGFVSSGFSLAISQTNSGGVIYYTLDGTDPRLIGGATASSAQLYGGPISINDNASVRARVKVGTNWSAVVEALFTTVQYFRDLAITEIMYNPPGTTNVDGDEFEFLELKNAGTNQLNLSGLSFTAGISFTFTNGTRIAPGAFLVLARNKAQFLSRHPGVPVAGTYGGRLDNSGETLTLSHALSGSIFSVTYGDSAGWPQAADGLGFSLVPVGPLHLNSDQSSHWRASSSAGGSPGSDDPIPAIPAVVINEILTHTAAGADFIELYNPTAGPVDIGGWFLTDAPGVPKKYRIPTGTMIIGNGYWVITESSFNPTPGLATSFTLSAEGEQVFLFSGDAQTNLTGYSHGFTFGAAAEEVTFGRHIISTGEEQFPAQLSSTSGSANAGPLIPAVVINEIQYNPRTAGDGFVEIKNRTGNAVPLYDPTHPTNSWRLNGVDFTFPANITLPAGGLALIVSTTPAAFRSQHSVPANVPVFGPYGGSLQNSGELVELQRLDFRGSNNFAWVTLDAVRYNDRAPWPAAAAGAGASLQRRDQAAYGNDPANWVGATPGPGIELVAGGGPVVTQQPANTDVVQGSTAMFGVNVTGASPFNYQWQFNGNSITGANSAMLTITNAQSANAGVYRLLVFNAAGSAESSNAVLTVKVPAYFTSQPQSVSLRGSTNFADYGNTTNQNATFTGLAGGTGALRYQWRFNGNNLPGATNTSLTVTNVQLTNDGTYDLVVTDDVAAVASAPARLIVLLTPMIIQAPLAQTLPVGSQVNVSVAIIGNPPPFGYQWRIASLVYPLIISNARTNFVSLPASTTVGAVTFRIVVTNAASPLTTVNAPFVITTVADADNDGMPDSFEMLYGPDSTSLSPTGDADGDGMSNLAEYLAGTDPSDSNSYLRVILGAVGGSASIQFGAVANRTYTVQFSDALTAPSAWMRLGDVLARNTNRTETIVDPGWTTNRFYRVATPRQP